MAPVLLRILEQEDRSEKSDPSSDQRPNAKKIAAAVVAPSDLSDPRLFFLCVITYVRPRWCVRLQFPSPCVAPPTSCTLPPLFPWNNS